MPRLKDQTQRQDAAFFLNAAYLHLVSESLVHRKSSASISLDVVLLLDCNNLAGLQQPIHRFAQSF